MTPEHFEPSLFDQLSRQILLRPRIKDRPKSEVDQATPIFFVELHQQPK